MNTPADTVFLLDVDNTLLDNDAVQTDLRAHLERQFGARRREEYWAALETLRTELGYVDYLGALQRYRLGHMNEPRLLDMSEYLIEYPFPTRLYPRVLELITTLSAIGPVAILSDGDVVFQPHKVRRSGLWAAVDGKVLIYIHKEQQLADVERRFPARHYVMIDDKLRILTAMKKVWGDRLTTVWPRQGHYAHDPKHTAGLPPPDVSIDAIGDLLASDLSRLSPAR